MFSRGAVAAFALIVAEFVVFGLAVRAGGFLVVVLVCLVAGLVGMAIVRRQIAALLASGRDALASLRVHAVGSAVPGPQADRALISLAGLLLIVPGLITGAIGVLLLVPPIRALVRGLARNRFARFVPSGLAPPFPVDGYATQRRGSFRADVVDVGVVSEDVPQSAPPELN